jgi:hypothetical protein
MHLVAFQGAEESLHEFGARLVQAEPVTGPDVGVQLHSPIREIGLAEFLTLHQFTIEGYVAARGYCDARVNQVISNRNPGMTDEELAALQSIMPIVPRDITQR